MRTTKLPDGTPVPVLGLGTWNMGDRRGRAEDEAAALRLGLDLGMTLIDTAEMYADGGAEEVVAKAIAGRRDAAFIVSKVYPYNASRRKLPLACERSLKRLGTDRLDLYLLHWRGDVPLAETVETFETLKQEGKILRWGVSNFDVDDMEELSALDAGTNCATNQVLYNLARRGIEFSLLPWSREHRMPIMAYSPVDQGKILGNAALKKIAAERGVSTARVALAWLARQDGIIVIPKAADPAHVRDNRAALDLDLSADELAALDRAFPAPKRAKPLEML